MVICSVAVGSRLNEFCNTSTIGSSSKQKAFLTGSRPIVL